jgi:hypothetical protein
MLLYSMDFDCNRQLRFKLLDFHWLQLNVNTRSGAV